MLGGGGPPGPRLRHPELEQDAGAPLVGDRLREHRGSDRSRRCRRRRSPAATWAARSSTSVAHSSPTGGAARSWAATRSGAAPASCISRAARAWASSRSPGGTSSTIASRTSGWANSSGVRAARIPTRDSAPVRVGDGVRLAAREPGDRRDVAAVAEDRDRAGDLRRLLRQPAQPGDDRPRDRPRPEVGDRRRRRARSASGPRARRALRVCWSSSGLPPDARRQASLNSASPGRSKRRSISAPMPSCDSGRGLIDDARRLGRDARDQRRVDARLGRALPGQQADPGAVEPVRQVGEEAERRPIAPLEVVDDEQHRLVAGDVEGHPEEAVEDREGDVAAGDGLLRGCVAASKRPAAGAAAPAKARIGAGLGDDALEELADDAEARSRSRARCPAPNGPRSPRSAARSGDLRDQHALADPGRSLDERPTVPPPAAIASSAAAVASSSPSLSTSTSLPSATGPNL